MKTEYDAFANSYDLEYGQTWIDLDFYVSQAQAAQPPVLELACGTGRVTIPIAQAGVPVVGVDSATEMLARAQEKVDSVGGLPVTLVEGDMRTFKLGERFGLAIIPARSFLHLLTPDDHKAALCNIREHLIDGGKLVMNFFVPSIQTIAAHSGRSLSQALMFSHEFIDPMNEQRIAVWESRSYDTHRQRIHVRFVYERLDADGTVVAREHKSYTLCYIFCNEMQHLFELCGYEVEALYGGFDKEPFTDSSTEMVWVAQKWA
jgi:ubiquinone/menaquinone biosynthesis C-methylase UbiE